MCTTAGPETDEWRSGMRAVTWTGRGHEVLLNCGVADLTSCADGGRQAVSFVFAGEKSRPRKGHSRHALHSAHLHTWLRLHSVAYQSLTIRILIVVIGIDR